MKKLLKAACFITGMTGISYARFNLSKFLRDEAIGNRMDLQKRVFNNTHIWSILFYSVDMNRNSIRAGMDM